MRVVFFDKQTVTFEAVPNVEQLQRKHNGKNYEWLCFKENGYTDKYKCSRFEIERIEKEMV
jgi:hypothetical protein